MDLIYIKNFITNNWIGLTSLAVTVFSILKIQGDTFMGKVWYSVFSGMLVGMMLSFVVSGFELSTLIGFTGVSWFGIGALFSFIIIFSVMALFYQMFKIIPENWKDTFNKLNN